MLLQELLHLLGKKGKERGAGFGDSELLRNDNLIVGEMEGCVAIEAHRAQAQISSAQVNREIHALGIGALVKGTINISSKWPQRKYRFCSVRYSRNVSWDLAQGRPIFTQTLIYRKGRPAGVSVVGLQRRIRY